MPKLSKNGPMSNKARQAKFRQRKREALRKLHEMQMRCQARVKMLQAKMLFEDDMRDDDMFGPHLNVCPFNEEDPQTIDEVIANFKADENDDADGEDNDDFQDAVEEFKEETTEDVRKQPGAKVISRGLKRKLEEITQLDPNDTTPEFSDSEQEDLEVASQALHSPVFKTRRKDKQVKQECHNGNESDDESDDNYIDVADDEEQINFVLKPISDDLESLSSHESAVFADRDPIHVNVGDLDFAENGSSEDDEEDGQEPLNFERMPIADAVGQLLAEETDDEEDIYYDAEEELIQEPPEPDPREDNAVLCHGTTLKDFKDALEKEERLDTQRKKNHALYARYFYLCSILAVTDRSAKAFWNFARSLTDRKLCSFKTMKKNFEKLVPPITMVYEFYDTIEKKTLHHKGSKFPRKKFPRPRYVLMSEWSQVDLAELIKFFISVHPTDFQCEHKGKMYLDLFLDGVPLANSSDSLMSVLCARFCPCRKVWPVAVHIYRKGNCTSILDLCDKFLKECVENNVIVRRFIGDSPMRAKLKMLKGHAGYCSCEFCYCVGKYLKKAKKMSFPVDTSNYKRRTDAEWRQIAAKIAANPNLPEKEKFGLTGTSPLLQLEYFDIIRHFVPDPMHNVSLGVGRQMLKLLLKTKKGEITNPEGKAIARRFDAKWIHQELPDEFPRRPRALKSNLVHLKASEFIAIICCGFTHMYDALALSSQKSLRRTWIYFAWIVHAALLPDQIFKKIVPNDEFAFKLQKEFYRLFQQNFTKTECTFNLHTFSHLLEIRKLGHLSDFSAMPFESFFSYLKKIIKPYTLSFAKQVLLKSFISNMGDHRCTYKVRMQANLKKRAINNLAVTEDGLFYYVHSYSDTHYECSQVMTKPFVTPEAPELDWSQVLVKQVDYMDNELVEVPKEKMLCKAVIAGDVLISVPNDVYFT